MKKIILSVLALAPALLIAQEDFSLKGTIDRTIASPAQIFLIYTDGGENHLDSIAVDQGKFSYNGTVSEPVQAHLVLSEDGSPLTDLQTPDATSLYLAKGVIKINGDQLKTAEITGNNANKEFQNIKR